MDLLSVATKGQLFQFNGALYEQTEDGVAMGSPLGPLLANVFMSHIEENLEREGRLPSLYRRYDTLTIMPNVETVSNFLDTLNKAHSSVKFTMETECNGMLPFLGIQLMNRSPQIETKVYVKPTNSGLLLHYQSHVDNRYKKGLLRTMLDRAHRLSSSWSHFSDKCDRLKTVFSRLKYPKHLVNSTIKSFVDSKVCDQQQPLSPPQETDDTIQVVLPSKDQISADIVRKLHWSNYKRLRNTINTRMRKEKSNYYSNQLAEEKDSKEMWRTLHKIVPKKTKTVPPSGDGLTASCLNGFFTSIADTLSRHFDFSTLPKVLTPKVNHDFVLEEVSSSFVRKELLQMKSTKATGLDGISARLLKDAAPEVSESITYIINLTISTSTIPSEWKAAKVTPIYKSGDKSDPNNYRPISVLPLISKVMERAIQSQLETFLIKHNLLSINQSGFRKKHSTETAAVYFVDHILEQMDRQMMTGSIFIDLRKALDLVDHQCLLHKLEHYGIREKSLKWFENYLTTRLQSVKHNQDISSNLAIGHGVPQGSILGPILFVIYINDLPQCLTKSSIGMYADDTVIYFSATSPGLIKQVLQNDLNYVEQWLQESKLVLNQSKTKWMLFGTRQKLEHSSDIEIQFHGRNIEGVSSFCYLGVTLDEHLSWNEHVEIICHKVSKRLGLLSRIRPYLTQKAAKCVYNYPARQRFLALSTR